MNEAQGLRDVLLTVPVAETLPQEPGTYYHYQLIDMDVVSTTGEELGRIAEILPTGANDVYVVLAPGKPELLIPATTDVVRNVDVAGRRMTVELLPGLR